MFQAYLILFSAQIAVCAAAIFARFALHGAGPLAVSALRLTIAALPLLLVSWSKSKALNIPRKHEVLFAGSGLTLAIHFAAWIGSLLYISVAVSTLLVSTVPVWTALYDRFVLKQRMPSTFWLAFAGGACGVALIVGTQGSAAPTPGFELMGDLLAIMGSIAFAAYLIVIRSISNLYPTVVVVGRTYSWAAVALALAALIAHQAPPGADLGSWGGIIAMALVSQILGHTGMNAALRWFSSSTVAFSTLLEPVFAAVLAAMIFSEVLSINTIAGCTLVLVCLAVILRLKPVEPQQEFAVEANEL